MENENIFLKYTYIPPSTCFPSSLTNENPLVETTSTDVKLMEKDNLKNRLQLDKNVSNDILEQSNENLKGSTLKDAREICKKNNILDDSLDNDFQDSQLQNKIKCNLRKIKRRLEEESFFCTVCKKDLTNSSIEERSIHMNQCIDNHAASSEESLSQTSNVFILDCPLCFKQFPSPELRSAHIKKCGKSRGLSIQSVIQAIHLQEKHVLERRALGLPLHRTNQTKPQKKNVSRKFTVQPKNAMQSDLQLAKALSLSLKENESQSHQNVASSDSKDIVQIAELQVPSELQNPGKLATKRKKPLNYVYPLLLRSEEEREKIILEKVNSLITQRCQPEPEVKLTETKLSTENQKVSILWNLSSKAQDTSSYYVEQLLDWIMPSDVEVGSKLCNLSQIPGHRIFTQLPCDYTFSSSDQTLNDKTIMPESSQLPSLINSLQSLIGNSWMSDIDIHTASGIVIPAHKLILALRCSAFRNAFDEPVSEGKYILNWQDISFDAALHFLNFLYTGTTEGQEDVFDELVQLATKYEVKDLLYILNNSRETVELLTDEDLAMEGCNVKLSSEDENNDVSICLNHSTEIPFSKDLGETYKNTKSTENIKIRDKHEQSYNLTKEISNKLITDCINHVQIQDRSGIEVLHDENKNVPDELYIVGSKFISEKRNDLFSSACNENSVCKMNIESCNTESDSSNDSCKIVKAEITSSHTPNNNIKIKSGISPNASSSSPGNWAAKNNVSSVLFSCNKNLKMCTPEKYEWLCHETPVTERTSDDSNEEIVVLSESNDIKKKVQNVSPVSFKGKLPIKGQYKLNRFSEAFSESPCFMYDENDDFNSAMCLSQNTSIQAGQVNIAESCRTNLNVSQTSVTSQKAMYSSHKDTLTKFDKIQVSNESDQLIKRVNNKDCYPDFSMQMHTDVGNVRQKEGIPSPEIFICDSDNEVDSILGKNYFQQENNSMKEKSSSYSNAAIVKQNYFSKSYSLSPVINDANLTRNSVIRNDKSVSPEVIYCDSSSNDNEDLSKRIQSLKASSDNAFRAPSNSPPDSVSNHVLVENMKKSSLAYSENMLLSSPESPWIFRTDKELLESACSSQFNTHTASEYIKTKKQIKASPLKCQNKNKSSFCPTTPNSSLAPQFKILNSPITPLPDYNNMQTPEIKEALKKIGVKVLPRKKAVAVLSHVYDETHPWNDEPSQNLERNLEPELQSLMKNKSKKKILSIPKKRKQETEICNRAIKKTHSGCSPPPKGQSDEIFNKEAKKITKSCCSSQSIKSNRDQMKNVVHFSTQATYPSEGNICSSPTDSCNSREDNEHNVSFSSELSADSQPECKENTESIKEYILSNEDLYKRILSYTPLNLSEFQRELKENGINVSIKKLMDYLDEQCITFTCPRKEEYKKKQQMRTQRFRKRMIAKHSQQGASNPS